MSTDLILKDRNIELVDLHTLLVKAKDLNIDHDERRGDRNSDRPRRALVHDFRDGLTLNWRGDYPAGVRVNGHFETTGSAAFQNVVIKNGMLQKDLSFKAPSDWPDLGDPPPSFQEGSDDSEESSEDITTPDGLATAVDPEVLNSNLIRDVVAERALLRTSLLYELKRLRAEVAYLKERVSALEE